jgi:Lipid II flippase MurJ
MDKSGQYTEPGLMRQERGMRRVGPWRTPRGEFMPRAAEGTMSALLHHAFGLCAFAGPRVVIPAFYALQDAKTPVRIGLYAMLARRRFS